MKDYYRILEVHCEASPEVIVRAYKTLVQKHHPDHYHLSDKSRANALMQDINEAYETLSEPVRRKRYDRAYQRYQAEQPTNEKKQRRAQTLQKLAYGFMLAVFVVFLLRGGAYALMINPVVRVVALVFLLVVVWALFKRKNAG